MGNPVAFDTETFLIRPGLQAPPLVCLSSAIPVTGARLYAKPEARQHFEWLLTVGDPIYTVNGAYDMCVCLAEWPDLFAAVFAAYDDSRVVDVALSQRLIDNAQGRMTYFDNLEPNGYSMAGLCKRLLKKDRSAEKEDPEAGRMRYHELVGVPVDEYPAAAAEYAKMDAQDTLDIGNHQWLKHREFLQDAPFQSRASFVLQLMMCWGVMTDPKRIADLREVSEKMFEELTQDLVKEGLVRGEDAPKKQRGTRNVRAAQRRMLEVCERSGRKIKLTETGYELFKEKAAGIVGAKPSTVFTSDELLQYVSVDEDACKESGDDVLFAYSRRTQLDGIVNTHVPDLLRGVETPIQPRYNTFVESGRTSCRKGKPKKKTTRPTSFGFQFQNPKRSLDYFPPGVGIRECFIARPGCYYADNDFGGLELHTGAQACIATVGYSELAKALNAGIDPHLKLAAQMMGISYEEASARKHDKVVKFHRQLAKPGNFGLPGGLGAHGLIGFARGYGVKLTEDQARQLIADWFNAWPEWNDYFKYIRGHIDPLTNRGQINQLALTPLGQVRSVGRVRGGCTYTSACNTLFQGLGADCAKRALYEVSKRCYVPELGSVLYGARPVGFIHDEILAEVTEDTASEQAIEMAQVMVDAANVFLPDVPVRCEPALCKRWSKDVAAVYDEARRLQPYDLSRAGRWRVFYSDGQLVEWR